MNDTDKNIGNKSVTREEEMEKMNAGNRGNDRNESDKKNNPGRGGGTNTSQ